LIPFLFGIHPYLLNMYGRGDDNRDDRDDRDDRDNRDYRDDRDDREERREGWSTSPQPRELDS